MKPLYDNLTATIALFTELLHVEEDKIEAVSANNVPLLDECIKKEEALSLKLRGYDKKREDAQKDLGFEGLTLQQIAERTGPPESERLLQLHEALSEKVQALGIALDCAKKLIDINSRSIESILASREAETAGYSKTGEVAETPDRPRLTVEEI